MHEKVDNFYTLAYGDLTPEEKLEKGHKNRMFILENLDKIEAYYDDCMKEGSIAQQEGLTESEIVKDAITHVKVEKFYELAYGDLTPEEKFKNGYTNRMFILENLDEIEAYYDDCMKEGSIAQEEGLTESEIVKDAITHVKVEKYYELAYGNLTPEEKFKNGYTRIFIIEHLDEIEAYYDEYMKEGSGAQHDKKTEQQIVQQIIDELRTKQITPQQIGQSTISASTIAKKNAEKVETGEKTLDKDKEGEEVGDGN